jgi:hypothetical protein
MKKVRSTSTSPPPPPKSEYPARSPLRLLGSNTFLT